MPALSIEALNWALGHMQRDDIESSTAFVLMILANRADPEGICWPSVKYIRARTKLADSTVRAACRLISELGLLLIEPQSRADGGKGTNRYKLCISVPPPPPIGGTPPPVTGDTPRRSQAGVPPPTGGQETKEETSLPDGKGSRPRSKKVQIPESFKATEPVMTWALERGLRRDYVELQLEAFIDDARSNQRLHADWDAALRTWIRRQPNFDRTAPRPMKGAKAAEQLDKRCAWPRRDSPDRCPVTNEQDKEGSWIGGGVFLCRTHLPMHYRAEGEKRGQRVADQAIPRAA